MNLKPSLSKILRLITFRISREELLTLNNCDLFVGLFFTWLVGVGRYWDNPNANLSQHLGMGSLVYAFVFAGLLWLLLKPFKIQNWHYKLVLNFLCFTSPLAILYGIPVEQFFDLDTAASINVWFLATVASWRVALLIFFLKRFAQLENGPVIVGSFLPITFIVVTLTLLNLEHAVFNLMAGLATTTSHDKAYKALIFISIGSIVLFIPLLMSYLFICYKRRKKTGKL